MLLHIRKTVERKLPHPGMPPPRQDPDKSGPILILVLDTDTSGTTSSQPQSQSRSHPSRSGTKGTPPPECGGIVTVPEEGGGRGGEADISTHDPEASKHPSFMFLSVSVDKGKGKARVVDDDERETETPRVQVGKKRRRSHDPTPPVQKRVKVNKEESQTEGGRHDLGSGRHRVGSRVSRVRPLRGSSAGVNRSLKHSMTPNSLPILKHIQHP
ncbi:hypothetical protein HYDPIDRAFT_120433 [Hydnomerulius pinastri MD-312]|uniref:Uncharacterized protein n=1 Tax=Hydnomerulius pinastri MD-312 TaxID=994086 RepID=A0A0C9VWT6_9AGAM|nr:hypothetical protein HYDPIDRAFT_120440 [Hydnomerulius pinastri MD-312]KIJ57697.1 hypothetical protein HYDPIDRAFT_120433 [Hydnomerulius pinastri MD-312]